MKTSAILAVCLGLLMTNVWAAPDIGKYVKFDPADYSQVVTECDRRAGHPEDPYGVVAGNKRAEMDLPKAIEVCTAAVAADPTNPRLRYQLARSYGYSNMGDKAMEHRLAAVRAGYPQSLFVVGYLYSIGQTIDKDICTAAELFRRSAIAGRLAGQVAFPHHVMRGDFDKCPVKKDMDEMKGFLAAAKASTSDFYQTMLIEELMEGLDEG